MNVITKFSTKEKKDIKKSYGEWDLKKNRDWADNQIKSELSQHYTPYILKQLKTRQRNLKRRYTDILKM